MAITGTGKPERIYGALTSANYFEVLGVQPILGRTLLPSLANERAGAPEAVLGYDLWQNRFAGDPGDRRQDDPDQSSHLHHRWRRAARLSGMQDRAAHRDMDSLGHGRGRSGARRGSTTAALPGSTCWACCGRASTRARLQNELNLLMQRIAESYPESHQGHELHLHRSRCGVRLSAPMSISMERCPFCWRWRRCCCCWPAPMWPICCWCARWRGAANGHSPLDGREPLEDGAPTHGGEPADRSGRRRRCAAAHALDGRTLSAFLPAYHAAALRQRPRGCALSSWPRCWSPFLPR